MTETVEYAIRCADGVLHCGPEHLQERDAEEVRLTTDRIADLWWWCGGKPHTVVSRRRIVTDWEPVR
jgi:hypothetical protein